MGVSLHQHYMKKFRPFPVKSKVKGKLFFFYPFSYITDSQTGTLRGQTVKGPFGKNGLG